MEQIGTPQYSYILPAKINQPIYDANPSTNYMTTTETAQYQTVSIPTQLISTVPLVNTTPQPQVPLPIPTVSLIQTPQPIIQQLPSPQPVVTTQPMMVSQVPQVSLMVSQVPQVPQVPVTAQPENHFVSNYPIYEDDPRRSVLKKSIFDTSALGYNPDDFRSRITLPQLAFTGENASTLGTTTGTNLPPVTTSTALPAVSTTLPAVSTTLPDISTTLPPVTTLTPGVATSLAGTVDNMANISGLNTLNNISTGLSDKLNTGVNNVTSGIGNVADSVNNAATGLGNTVKDGINDIKNIF